MTIALTPLSPGSPLIDTVSQFDFVASAKVLAANANLTHAMSLLFLCRLVAI